MENRPQESTASVVNVLAGLWLIISPFVLGFPTGTAMVNTVILGIIIGVLALTTALTDKYPWTSWINIILGIWLIASPFLLRYVGLLNATWNNLILGVLVIVFAGLTSSFHASGHQIRPA